MTTSEVVKLLAARMNITQAAARSLLYQKLTELGSTLVEENSVSLPKLGKIQVKTSSPRRSYLPSKNRFCIIPERKRIRFKLAAGFKKLLLKRGA